MDAFRHLHAVDGSHPFYPWFYVLLRNRCLKQRSRRRTRLESAEIAEPAVEANISDAHIDLWRAIGRLDPDAAELIVLKHIEGWTYEELSAALGVPRGTLMRRLFEVRQRLSALLLGDSQ